MRCGSNLRLLRRKTSSLRSEEKVSWSKHAMLFGDFAFQPISHTPVMAHMDRRIRWLRVRKFTVTLATFVEPGTESDSSSERAFEVLCFVII
jgi:hypothetical protein